jgi:hypothetical protein
MLVKLVPKLLSNFLTYQTKDLLTNNERKFYGLNMSIYLDSSISFNGIIGKYLEKDVNLANLLY